VRHHLRYCLGGLYVLPYLRGARRAAAPDSATLSARSRYPSGCDEVSRVRYRTEPSVVRLVARCPVLPRPSVHGMSPGCLSWLYESPAAPDLPLMIPELPANQRVVCCRARFSNSHSSLDLVLLCHTRDSLYAGLAHGVWFPFFPFSLMQPLFRPPPRPPPFLLCAIKFTTSLLDVLSCSHVLQQLRPPAYP
jgi:hypothetical protein